MKNSSTFLIKNLPFLLCKSQIGMIFAEREKKYARNIIIIFRNLCIAATFFAMLRFFVFL